MLNLSVLQPARDEIVITPKELVAQCATDSILFSRAFFPKTARQEAAPFHPQMWELLDGTSRFVNMLVFRGGAKTTILRMFAAKRIAYGLSKTILIVGKSQGHASQYLYWLRKQIEPIKTPTGEKRTLFAETFDLRKGSKWDDEKIHIQHGIEGDGVWVVALGITGSTRGLNFDDWRPDLIVVDDVVDEENASSPEQCLKINNLVHGSLVPSLAPASEAPFAKLVILQTPQDYDDVSQRALRDQQFQSARFGCWTAETEDLPIDQKESIWPARWTSETRRTEYLNAMAKNELSIFAREYECRLLTPETSIFREEWIQYFGEDEDEPEPAVHEMWCELVIDPVPPPSEKQIAIGLVKKDYEALVVVGKKAGKYYVLETSAMKGHDPSWTVNEFFRMAQKWRIRRLRVEGTGYQRTLSWLISQAMLSKAIYYPITTFDDKQKKFHIISTGTKGVLSHKQLYLRREQTMLIHQIIHYPNVKNDDELEATARCLIGLQSGVGVDGDEFFADDEDSIPELEYVRGAP
jgi:phage terminase large subunit-like protein